MFKKTIIFMAAAALLVTSLAGCGSKAASTTGSDEPVTIKYLSYSAQPDHIKDLEKMIAAFEKENPKIKVKYETCLYDDYFTKLQTLAASKTLPDVFEINYENFVNYASKGSLLDLSGVISNDKSFDPSVYDKTSYDAYKYQGKQYGLVEKFSTCLLFYNKDLFDKAGVAYPNENWTWQDELAAAQKLTDTKKGIWGTYSPIQFYEFYKTIAQNGGSMFSDDMKTVTINSKQNVETLQWMIDKINKYHVTPTDAEMSGQKNEDMFKAGKIAMLRTGTWMFSYFKDAPFKWDVTLEPGNTQKAHHFFSEGVAISKDTKQAEAAWKWAKFFTSNKDCVETRVETGWDLPAVSDSAVYDSFLKQTPPDNRKAVLNALKTLVVPPVIENEAELADTVNKELDAARLGKKTPQKALDDAKTEIEKLIQ